jgi:hypothetical protein
MNEWVTAENFESRRGQKSAGARVTSVQRTRTDQDRPGGERSKSHSNLARDLFGTESPPLLQEIPPYNEFTGIPTTIPCCLQTAERTGSPF